MTSFERGSLTLEPGLARNRWNQSLTLLAALFTGLAVLPLVVVIAYVLIKGGSLISLQLLTQLPPPPASTAVASEMQFLALLSSHSSQP